MVFPSAKQDMSDSKWNWLGGPLCANWDDFRQWYYAEIVGRPWNGRPNETIRRGTQDNEQKVHDLWRKHMGYDAPWTDVMLLYDHRRVIGLGEVKMSWERWSPWNQAVAEDAARRLGVPLVLVRFTQPEGPMTVQVYRLAKDK